MWHRFAVAAGIAAALTGTQGAFAQAVTPGMTVTLEGATKMVRACEAFAREKGLKVAIWVVDTTGTPIAMKRMEGAYVRTVAFARWKAETAMTWEGSTDPQNANALLGQVFNRPGGQSVLDRTDALLSAGGLPVRVNGVIVGAVGVGGAGQNDEPCAQAAINAVGQ